MSPASAPKPQCRAPSGHQDQLGDLLSRLSDPSVPVFLLGSIPPEKHENTSISNCMESAAELVTSSRVLAYDGFCIYGVDAAAGNQDVEAPPTLSSSTPNQTGEEWETVMDRGRLMDPSQYANLISKMARSHNCKGDCIVTKTISKDDLGNKVDDTLDHLAIQLMMDPQNPSTPISTNQGEYSMKQSHRDSLLVQALKIFRKKEFLKGDQVPFSRYGGVAFAERHTLEFAKAGGKEYPTEHLHMMEQQTAGAEWFLTLPIYDPEPIQFLLKDYATACVANGLVPKKVILTFAPFSNASTLQSIQSYCGITVPENIQSRILSATNPMKESADCLRDIFVAILESSQGLELPSLGMHCLQISQHPSDLDVTRDLFLKLQYVLLTSQGTPWRMQWYDPTNLSRTMQGNCQNEDSDVIRDTKRWKMLVKHGIYAALVGGGLVAFGVMLGATGDFLSVKVTVMGRDLALSNQIGDS